jgi:hypothetical protein
MYRAGILFIDGYYPKVVEISTTFKVGKDSVL